MKAIPSRLERLVWDATPRAFPRQNICLNLLTQRSLSRHVQSPHREIQSKLASHCKHGPRFLSLSPEEKSMLVKIHRNMGHPSAERLTHLLRQQGFRKECIDAVTDMRCSTCEITSKPKCSRPGVVKDPMDFNDKIAIDCLK